MINQNSRIFRSMDIIHSKFMTMNNFNFELNSEKEEILRCCFEIFNKQIEVSVFISSGLLNYSMECKTEIGESFVMVNSDDGNESASDFIDKIMPLIKLLEDKNTQFFFD